MSSYTNHINKLPKRISNPPDDSNQEEVSGSEAIILRRGFKKILVCELTTMISIFNEICYISYHRTPKKCLKVLLKVISRESIQMSIRPTIQGDLSYSMLC